MEARHIASKYLPLSCRASGVATINVDSSIYPATLWVHSQSTNGILPAVAEEIGVIVIARGCNEVSSIPVQAGLNPVVGVVNLQLAVCALDFRSCESLI
jgi:hypothetical protein